MFRLSISNYIEYTQCKLKLLDRGADLMPGFYAGMLRIP